MITGCVSNIRFHMPQCWHFKHRPRKPEKTTAKSPWMFHSNVCGCNSGGLTIRKGCAVKVDLPTCRWMEHTSHQETFYPWFIVYLDSKENASKTVQTHVKFLQVSKSSKFGQLPQTWQMWASHRVHSWQGCERWCDLKSNLGM